MKINSKCCIISVSALKRLHYNLICIGQATKTLMCGQGCDKFSLGRANQLTWMTACNPSNPSASISVMRASDTQALRWDLGRRCFNACVIDLRRIKYSCALCFDPGQIESVHHVKCQQASRRSRRSRTTSRSLSAAPSTSRARPTATHSQTLSGSGIGSFN